MESDIGHKEAWYWVIIGGDWEHDDMGGVIYDFDDYITLMKFWKDEDGELRCNGIHDEEEETVLMWHSKFVLQPEMPKL